MRNLKNEIIESFYAWPRWLLYGSIAATLSSASIVPLFVPSIFCGVFSEGFLIPVMILELLIFGRDRIPAPEAGSILSYLYRSIYAIVTIDFWFVTGALLGKYVKNLFYSAVIIFLMIFCGMIAVILLAYG